MPQPDYENDLVFPPKEDIVIKKASIEKDMLRNCFFANIEATINGEEYFLAFPFDVEKGIKNKKDITR